MIKIQISELAKPSVKLTGPDIDTVDPTRTTPRHILTKLKAADKDLIVDKTASILRIALNDPVNEYFNGRLGDMYRIVDDSSTRFRMVAGTLVTEKTKTTPFHDVTAKMYYSAYDTVLDMLKDRRNGSDIDDADVDRFRITPTNMAEIFNEKDFRKLKIQGVENRRGQFMYVYFLDDTPIPRRLNARGPLKELIKGYEEETLAHFNSIAKEQLDAGAPDFYEKIEMVIVFNNQQNNSLVKLDTPVQLFSVQQLVFNVTKHMDQPTFYLLDPFKDRAEILDVLSLNGLVLDKDKPLSEFNIKEGMKLLVV